LKIANFHSLRERAFTADIVIIGGGPAGLTVAREFFNTPYSVLVLESGLEREDAAYSSLNTVESRGEPGTPAQKAKRQVFHAENAKFWRQEEQPFGVRCRTLGGSTAAWAGKSAAFDPIDYAARPWVAHSGWPFGADHMTPFLARAGTYLNLGPHLYGEEFWAEAGRPAPEPMLRGAAWRSFFWQFARSRRDPMDLMRFGPDFAKETAPNVRVLLNATATEILTTEDGHQFAGVTVSSLEGAKGAVTGKVCVLAASGIENPRLLLASRRSHANGIGNRHDCVGRFLMDHPGAQIARFAAHDLPKLAKRFGFYSLNAQHSAHMYMHGLALSPEVQAERQLLNGAVYMMHERAPDDPWDALKRLITGKSKQLFGDIWAILKSPGLIATGLAKKAFQHALMPKGLRDLIINLVIRFNPNFVAQEFMGGGLPHKLTGMSVDAICEQAPRPDSRITLSEQTDSMGVPRARVEWLLDLQVGKTLIHAARLLQEEFKAAGLPEPILEDWVREARVDKAAIIDMAHTLGATRMASDPQHGVVDTNCQVHGVQGLFVAGGSVFPTSGHANPTLMIVALAVRLADHLKLHLARGTS
jgi:choline dehydrogenase-like flavoprotein